MFFLKWLRNIIPTCTFACVSIITVKNSSYNHFYLVLLVIGLSILLLMLSSNLIYKNKNNPENKTKKRFQGFQTKNKYFINFYRDILLLYKNIDFLVAIAIVIFIFIFYFTNVPMPKNILYICNYLIIWTGSLTSQAVFIVDLKYQFLLMSLINNRLRFKLKLFEVLLICYFPSVLFLVGNLITAFISFSAFLVLVILNLAACFCLAFGSCTIIQHFYPTVKRSTTKLFFYYPLVLVPVLVIPVILVITLWGKKRLKGHLL